LPEGLFTLTTHLQWLSLRGNQLNTLTEGLFEKLSNLKYLNLSYNQLVLLDSSTFRGLDSIESIDVSYNFLSHINEDTFASLNKLRKLNLHRNFLKSLHLNTFKRQARLEELLLSFNKFIKLEKSFFDELLTSSGGLVEIRLDMNRLNNAIHSCFFKGFLNLKYLHIAEFYLFNPGCTIKFDQNYLLKCLDSSSSSSSNKVTNT
jgi:Leucine-rich repeat (LRR) protein